MKKTLKTLVLLFGLSIVIASCGKDDDSATPTDNTNNDPTVETPGIFVKVNFQDRSASPFSAVIKNGSITITGQISNLELELKANATQTGTYTTKLGTGHVITYAGVYTTEITDGDGRITIAKIDTEKKTISGTFNANVYQPGNPSRTFLTEGKFISVPYTEE